MTCGLIVRFILRIGKFGRLGCVRTERYIIQDLFRENGLIGRSIFFIGKWLAIEVPVSACKFAAEFGTLGWGENPMEFGIGG